MWTYYNFIVGLERVPFYSPKDLDISTGAQNMFLYYIIYFCSINTLENLQTYPKTSVPYHRDGVTRCWSSTVSRTERGICCAGGADHHPPHLSDQSRCPLLYAGSQNVDAAPQGCRHAVVAMALMQWWRRRYWCECTVWLGDTVVTFIEIGMSIIQILDDMNIYIYTVVVAGSWTNESRYNNNG